MSGHMGRDASWVLTISCDLHPIGLFFPSYCVKPGSNPKKQLVKLCPYQKVNSLRRLSIYLYVIITIQLLLAWLCLFGDQCSSFTLY